MSTIRLAPLLLLGMSAAATAQSMPVSNFLTKSEALQKKGPLALFSGDLKLLMAQVKADAAAIRAERLAAKAAGKPTAFCPPAAGTTLTDKDILAAMQEVPPARRAATSTRDALKAFLIRRHPCR